MKVEKVDSPIGDENIFVSSLLAFNTFIVEKVDSPIGDENASFSWIVCA